MCTSKETTTPGSDAIMEYRAQVRAWIATGSPVIFGNYSTAHAACVVEEFAKCAQSKIDLMTGSFSSSFYCGAILSAFADAARRGVKIRIITSDPTAKCDNLEALVNDVKTGIKPDYFIARYNGKEPASHFMVVDGKRYRLERGIHSPNEEDRPIVQAEVCCYGVERARYLEDFFELVWNRLCLQRDNKSTSGIVR